jgi:hypothetical protein
VTIDFGEFDTGFGPVLIKQAEVYSLGHARKNRKVCARTIVGGPERCGLA